MSKGLEAFKRIKSYFNPKQLLTKEKTLNDLDTIEKELKALDILRNKLSPIGRVTMLPMDQEEFDILVEVGL